ncbi:MAG TPA: DUF4198 domain-containing protein [Burkholderiaceae bacterium]
MITLHKPAALLAVILTALAGHAHAHRPWLLPSSTFVDDKEAYITVDGAVSELLFDFDHMPLRIDNLKVYGPDGAVRALENTTIGKRRTTFDLKLAQPGTYKLALVNAVVMASYKAGGEEKRWRGTEEALAKEVPANAQDLVVNRSHARVETFVTSVKPDFAVFAPTNTGLEMVPVTHPNELRAGEPVRLRFLIDGKPVANLPLSLTPGGVRYRGVINEQRVETDAKGEVAVTLADAGMYMLAASHPAGQSAKTGQSARAGTPPARRLSYSATLEVLPQ